MPISTPKFETRLVVPVDADQKQRIKDAAKVRDGGNLAHLVRRAVDRLIEEEQLLAKEDGAAA